ncbi:class I SAM-dependent methyltransferase [bacterium]|nr:class I SAM-dependent methyltransferase [bacterium]
MEDINLSSPLQAQFQLDVELRRAQYLEQGAGTAVDKNRSLMRFMSRQELAKLYGYIKLFELTKGILGSIADCGVYFGQGLMAYANLSTALEPYNYPCRIYGFDTFEGSTSYDDMDFQGSVDLREHNYHAPIYDDILKCIKIFDGDRPLNHIPKIELIKGDLVKTAPQFIADRPETIFRIIHLSVNLYKPTKVAIENFYPRLSRGGILAVNSVNYTPSTTCALLDSLKGCGVSDPKVLSFDFNPNLSFHIKE